VKKISCKTLVMRGETTNVLDIDQAEKMVSEIPSGNGSTIEIKGSGHGLHNDNLEGTANAIRAFLMS
jgi:pimeloyl-ACP methyl ester carboxylesterase